MARIPARSEAEAFRLTVAGAAAILVAILVGWLAQPLIGAALFGLFLAFAVAAYLRSGNPDRRARLREAAHDPHPHGARSGRRHVLVVANRALGDGRLLEHLAGRDGEQVEVDILAPVLTSRLHYGTSDIDSELAEARERLGCSLAWARQQGIPARGEVGDPDPATAIEDELRDFGADEVIVVTHPGEQKTWQERQELERLRGELDVPVTQLAAGPGERASMYGPEEAGDARRGDGEDTG